MSPDLDEDLPLELVGWWQAVCSHVHRLSQQHVPKHFLKLGGHIPLLHDTTVVLDGQDDGISAGWPKIRINEFQLITIFVKVWFSYFFSHTKHTEMMSAQPHRCFRLRFRVCAISLSRSSLICSWSLAWQLLKRNGKNSAQGDSLGCDEGMLFDGGQDITKLDFCCEGVSVVDDWHSIWTIPAVHWK